MSNLPQDLRFAKSHEWVRFNDDGTATIGISDHAQQALGDLVFVELPEVGKQLEAGEACATVESVKAASDIYAPISGEVVAINETLADAPEIVNQGAFGDGWLMTVRSDDTGDQLLSAADYEKVIADES